MPIELPGGIELYSTKEACEKIGRTKKTIFQWMKEERLKDVSRDYKQYRIWTEEDIIRYWKFVHQIRDDENAILPSLQRQQPQNKLNKVISVSIQKGGVGKTTLSVSLSFYLALRNYKTLVIDFCGQGNATSVLLPEGKAKTSLKNVLIDSADFASVISPSKMDNLDIIPANTDLTMVDRYLLSDSMNGMYFLKDFIAGNELNKQYDLIIIDTPPSLGALTTNALVASDFVLIPLTCAKYSLEGILELEKTISTVQSRFNQNLQILGTFINMYESNKNVTRELEPMIGDHFGDKLFSTRVNRTIRLEEATLKGMSVYLYDPKSSGSMDFANLCNEILIRLEEITEEEKTQ